MPSVTSVLSGSLEESPLSRGTINMNAAMNRRMPNEFHDLDVAVVLVLAVNARPENEEETRQRKRDAAALAD